MKSASALLVAVVLVAATVASAADIAREVRGKCRQQMREQEEKLQHCQRYMRSAVQGAACGGGGGCESRSNEDCCARECCRALRRMDEECACQTVKALAQQKTSEMTGRQLASRCGVTQQCDTRAVFV